jgi:hypothetical protein
MAWKVSLPLLMLASTSTDAATLSEKFLVFAGRLNDGLALPCFGKFDFPETAVATELHLGEACCAKATVGGVVRHSPGGVPARRNRHFRRHQFAIPTYQRP